MRRKQPTTEQIAAARLRRAELARISAPIQMAHKAGILPFALLPTLNACLQLVYSQKTGQTEWSTFMGWKERGFSVEKGTRGFAVWGRLIGADGKQQKAEAPAEAASDDEASFFPVSYIFHAGQVANAAGQRPQSFNPFAAAIAAARSAPLALPAPALAA